MSKKITESLPPVFYGDATSIDSSHPSKEEIKQYAKLVKKADKTMVGPGLSPQGGFAFDPRDAVIEPASKSKFKHVVDVIKAADKESGKASKHFVKVSPSKKG